MKLHTAFTTGLETIHNALLAFKILAFCGAAFLTLCLLQVLVNCISTCYKCCPKWEIASRNDRGENNHHGG